MPNGIKYTTSTVSNTLRKGNAAIAVNAVDYGPTSTTGFYTGVTPREGEYIIYRMISSGGPKVYTAHDDAEAIKLIGDILGGSYGSIGDALAAANVTTDLLVISRSLNDIPTSQLVTGFDVRNTVCYPKTSDKVYDLSNNGYHFTGANMATSPTYVASGATASNAYSSALNTDYHSLFFILQFKSSGPYPDGWTGGWEKIFGYEPSGTDRSPGIWRYPTQRLLHWRYDPGNSGCDFGKVSGYAVEFDINTMYFVGVTKDGAYALPYVNGVPFASFVSNYVSNPKVAGASSMFLFPYYTTGLCEIRAMYCYDRVLSAEEVLHLYYRGQIVTSNLKIALDSDNPVSHKSELADTAWSNLTDTSLQYSGNVLPDVSYLNDISQITICLLFEKTSYFNGYATHPVNKWNTAYNVNSSFILYHFGAGYGNPDGLLGWYGTTTDNGWNNLGGFYTMDLYEIAHIVWTYNSSTGATLWVNGVLQGSSGQTGLLGSTAAGATSDVGVYGPAEAGYSRIHQLQIYNRTLTEAEIIQNFKTVENKIRK
jgi:hypothetical protein